MQRNHRSRTVEKSANFGHAARTSANGTSVHVFGHDIVVVGASAGGVEALGRLLSGLNPALAASVFVVLHLPPGRESLLWRVLQRRSPLCVQEAIDGERIQRGVVYTAPPDFHLRIMPGYISLSSGPRENHHRPAIDVLFRSAAGAYGPRVIGVILTGYLDDGTAGLYDVKAAGGIAVVQDPKDAQAPAMPQSALQNVEVDHCLPLSDIPRLLNRLTRENARPQLKRTIPFSEETMINPVKMSRYFGPPGFISCPECGGSLWYVRRGPLLQLRCHVGHVYSPQCLLAEHDERVEQSLWSSARILSEHAGVLRKLSNRATAGDFDRMEQRSNDLEESAAVILNLISRLKGANQ